MRIHLDDEDAPNPADREAATRIVEEIISNDVFTAGSFVLAGYSSARRIAQALTAARRDERRQGFWTPYRMRRTKVAPGSPIVMAKRPDIRPLYHWIEVDGVRFQSYRWDSRTIPLISDDGRISVLQRADFWVAHIDGVEVITCGLTRRFETAEDAVRAALEKIRSA